MRLSLRLAVSFLMIIITSSYAVPFISFYASKPKHLSPFCSKAIDVCIANCARQYTCKQAEQSIFNHNACYGCEQLCVKHNCSKTFHLPRLKNQYSYVIPKHD